MLTINDLSKEQREIYNSILKWMNDKQDKRLIFSGVAGSGKTTILTLLAANTSKTIAFACYTGKAANVLREKLDNNKIHYSYVGTIHGLMYIPIIDKYTLQITGWKRRPDIDEDIIVIDEASMVTDRIQADLQYYGKKILYVGDSAQLPPIESKLNLMEYPNLMLDEIHRQAADNPIIKLSAMIRKDEDISKFECDDNRVRFLKRDSAELDEIATNLYKDKAKRLDSAILCYFNKSRIRFNSIIRNILKFENDPNPGDVVICLKNSKDMYKVIFNGMRGLVESCRSMDKHRYNMWVDFVDDKMKINDTVSKHQFNCEQTFQTPLDLERHGLMAKTWEKIGLLFDYGYALTVHKSQGSEFDNVIVFIERSRYCDDDTFRRWKYTSATRAVNNLILAF